MRLYRVYQTLNIIFFVLLSGGNWAWNTLWIFISRGLRFAVLLLHNVMCRVWEWIWAVESTVVWKPTAHILLSGRVSQVACYTPRGVIRATSHTWPCKCESPWFSSKGHTIDMVYWECALGYIFGRWVTCKFWYNHETLLIVCHVRIHVDFSSMMISLGLYAFAFGVNWTWTSLRLFYQWEVLEWNGHGPSVSCVKWS